MRCDIISRIILILTQYYLTNSARLDYCKLVEMAKHLSLLIWCFPDVLELQFSVPRQRDWILGTEVGKNALHLPFSIWNE